MSTASILVVDDSSVDLEIVSIACAGLDCAVEVARDPLQAIELYQEKRHTLVLTDYNMEPMDGIELIERIRAIDPHADCMIMTGYPDHRVNRLVMQGDIQRIVTKPIRLASLIETIRVALNRYRGATGHLDSIALTNRMDDCLPLLGRSVAIREARKQLSELIRSHRPLLIEAPEGSRKYDIASFVHRNGAFANSHYVTCDCSEFTAEAQSRQLISADAEWGALLNEARHGTLVLSSIEGLALELQQALARSFREVTASMHLIVLTEQPLEDLLAASQLIDQFYFQIVTDTLCIPALSERTVDIEDMLAHLAETESPERYGLSRPLAAADLRVLEAKLSAQALERNVDELLERVAAYLDSPQSAHTAN